MTDEASDVGATDGARKPWMCVHLRTNGVLCRGPGMKGTEPPTCRKHGGGAPQVRAAAKRRLAKKGALEVAEKIRLTLGGSLEVSPLDLLIGQVKEAAANVAVYRLAIEGLGVEVARDGAVALPEQVIEFEKGGTHVPAKVHILVELYNQERDRAVKFAKLCLDAGVEERLVQVAEQDAQRLGRAFAGALDDVADLLSDETRAALRAALGQRLRALVAG